uniref:Cobyrinic acid ac-diamide synthase n=2 Tax=Gloeothece TaxID=28070 RepID=E0UL68_GLOV7|nr:Cobyrinic acid ac-diamide synthase [Gloeothece verrucosa PCC 7822]
MPEASKQATVITVSCLSGGSGKSTTVLNLATMLSGKGKTLAVDFDPQGNLSQWLGWTDLSNEPTIAEAILPSNDRVPITEIIKTPKNENRSNTLFLAPSDFSLAHAADIIAPNPGRERFLSRALKSITDEYQFIVIDSPPSKGILTYNAILAADFLVIPTECTNKGVMGAINTVQLVRELAEIDFVVPHILGIVPTRDQWAGANQTRMSKAAMKALEESLPSIRLFSSLRQSTIVQQTNMAGWSLAEAGETKLSKPYVEVINTVIAKING